MPIGGTGEHRLRMVCEELTMNTVNPVTCDIEHTVVNNTSKIGHSQYDVYGLIVFIIS